MDDDCRTHMTGSPDEDTGPQIAECMNCAKSTEHEVLRKLRVEVELMFWPDV